MANGWNEHKERKSPPRLNMWTLYTTVPKGILIILNTWYLINGYPSSGEDIYIIRLIALRF